MTILVCGGSGILGKELCVLLAKNNINYIATYNKNNIENGIKINFLSELDVYESLKDKNITVCINCIVERQVNICETDWKNIKSINIDITQNIAKVCERLNIFLIHISTDYVFDGKNAPYYPTSQVNPLQNYGISKLLSEYKVMANCKKYSIVRVPVLYTEKLNNLEDSAVTLIGKKILDRRKIYTEDNYSIRRPNYIPDFCNFILKLILSNQDGIFHFCNPYDKVSKYQIANIIGKYLEKKINIEPINIEPNDGIERPFDTMLLDDKYNIKDYIFTTLNKGIENCFKKLYHPKLDLNTNNNFFFMIDLDGTLIDTDKLHYYAYKTTFEALFNNYITYDNYNKILEDEGIDNYIKKTFGLDNYEKIKCEKNKNLKSNTSIEFIKNAQILIDYIFNNNINHVVVTNTSSDNVNFFKSLLPDLNKLKNWIVREKYLEPKPSSECYKLAKDLYYKNEEYIIGIENTSNGYKSIKNITNCIYMMIDDEKYDIEYIKKQDVYLINDFAQIFD
jgi:dTDP-4-dehydrorhamnose reductase